MSPERKLERRLVSFCKDHGLYCRKWVSPGVRGVPDRIIIGRKILFIELKSPGKTLDPLQARESRLITAALKNNPSALVFEIDDWDYLLSLLQVHIL